MNSSRQKEQVSGDARQAAPGVAWAIVIWGRVVVGLILGAVGGVVFGHAWTERSAPLWWVGAITVLTGVLLILSGLYARSRPPGVTPEFALREGPPSGQEPLVPLLGALLLYKYQCITQRQLNDALARQRRERNKRRLGEILVSMEAITRRQLEEALEYQRSVLRQKRSMMELATRAEDRPS